MAPVFAKMMNIRNKPRREKKILIRKKRQYDKIDRWENGDGGIKYLAKGVIGWRPSGDGADGEIHE